MNPVLNAAQAAYGRVLFYELLYRSKPLALDDVPFISSTHYHRATGTFECTDPGVEVCGVLPPFLRGSRRFPFSVLESDADIGQRQERLALALEDSGIGNDAPKRILMVSSEASGPFASDLSTGLGWEGHPASIYYWNGTREELAFQIEAHRPDFIVWCLPRNPLDVLDFPVEKTSVAHGIDEPLPEWAGPLWLFCDEANLVGSRPAGRATFRVARNQLHVETGPGGHPCLTTLRREAFPLVRYELPNPFEVLR